MELYEERVQEKGKIKADLRFIADVLLLFRPAIIKSTQGTYRLNFYGMLRHNLILAMRNFKKHKSSFLINLIGLSTGMAAVLLIWLWIADEVNKDQFHTSGPQLYQALRNIQLGERGIRTAETNSHFLIPLLQEEFPEVERAVAVNEEVSSAILSYDNGKVKGTGLHAGDEFFNIFSFPLEFGNRDLALADKNNIVLSRSMAERLFGDPAEAMGQLVHLLDNTDGEIMYENDYVVSGICDLSLVNTSMQFDFLLTNKLLLDTTDPDNFSWDSNSSDVYVVLREDVNIGRFEEKLDRIYSAKRPYPSMDSTYAHLPEMFLQKYTEKYLYNRFENGSVAGGRIEYVRLLGIVALIILLIAGINFINLSTALANRRMKELGIKKVVGASRTSLISQHLLESTLLTALAAVVAIVLVLLSLDYFNYIADKTISFAPDLSFLSYFLGFILLTALLAGSYPALFIAGFNPLQALKTRIKTSFGELLIRKGLIIVQFVVSTVLIVSVIVISRQIDFVQSKNLGYATDNLMSIEKEGDLVNGIAPFLEATRSIPGVSSATVLDGSPVHFSNSCGGFRRPGRPPMQFTFGYVGFDYIKTMGIELTAGRSFSRKFSNEHKKIILNETAIAQMGIEDPIGKVVNIRGNREIIGIVKDFHYLSLHHQIEPMFLIYEPEDANTIVIKVKNGTEKQTIASLEEIYHQFNPGLTFNFNFLDESYNRLYRSEQRVGRLAGFFAIIAILISCLGLFGLAAFSTERRIKEIGIRKILGAGSRQIVYMLTSDFTKMVLIAIAAAVPFSYWLLSEWLSNFAYRIDLNWSFFVLGAILTLAIAWLTVALRTLKAANVNPSKCIRDE